MIHAILIGHDDEVVTTFDLTEFRDVVHLPKPKQARTILSEGLFESLLNGIDTIRYDYDATETELAQLLHGPDTVIYRRRP